MISVPVGALIRSIATTGLAIQLFRPARCAWVVCLVWVQLSAPAAVAAAALSGALAAFLHPSVAAQISLTSTTRLAIRVFRPARFAWPADVAPVKAGLG